MPDDRTLSPARCRSGQATSPGVTPPGRWDASNPVSRAAPFLRVLDLLCRGGTPRRMRFHGTGARPDQRRPTARRRSGYPVWVSRCRSISMPAVGVGPGSGRNMCDLGLPSRLAETPRVNIPSVLVPQASCHPARSVFSHLHAGRQRRARRCHYAVLSTSSA